MSLTGPLFLNGIIVLTVLAFVLVVVAWPRLTGSTPGRVAGRVGALLMVNVLVLLTAATQLNATYLFFAGWSDLQGAITGHIAQTPLDRGGAAARAAGAKVQGATASVAATVPPLKANVSPDGVASFTVTGALSGLTGTVVVQLPPGYDSPAQASTRYPVLEAFGGYPGSPFGWVRNMHIGTELANAVAARNVAETLVVSPQVEFPAGVDTEAVNGVAGRPQVETWLTQDVPNWIGRTFRVRPDRASWATIGFSAGGWAAAMAAILHPAQYGASIVLGGYFRPEFGPFYEPYPPTDPLARRYDLPRRVRKHPPPVAMWVETSHADPISYKSSAAFLAATKAPLSVHAVVLQNAGHRLGVWTALLPEALRWLGTNASGFHP